MLFVATREPEILSHASLHSPLPAPSGEIADPVAVMRDATARFEETKALRQQLQAVAARSPD
jgi:hypothetical protein